MSRAWVGVVLLCLCVAPRAQAEDHERRDVYKIKPWVDGTVIGVSGLGVILPYAFDNSLINFSCPCNPNQINAFDRHVIGNANGTADTISDVTVGLAMAAPVVVDLLDVGWSRPLLDDMVVYAETLAVNSAVNNLFKYTVQRPIPRTFAGTPQLLKSPSGYRSFYSGHTSTTFAALSAMSMTLTLRHGATVWPWLITAVVGTSVAVERVAAGRHFYTDVIVAAFMGTSIGMLVPWLHARARWGAPTVGVEAGAVLVGWNGRW